MARDGKEKMTPLLDDDRRNDEPFFSPGRGSASGGRRHPRYPLDLSMEYQVLKAPLLRPPFLPHPGRAEEISKGGLRLLLPERLPPLTVIRCTLNLPERPIVAEIEIVWVERGEGGAGKKPAVRHGVQFLRMGPEEQDAFDRFICEGIHKLIGLPGGKKPSSSGGEQR